MNKLLTDVSDRAYYGDRIFTADDPPTFSQTSCGHIVQRSEYHCWLWHPRLGGQRPARTDALDGGNVVDQLVLSGGAEPVEDDHECPVIKRAGKIAVVDVRDAKGNPADGFRSKAAKERKAELESQGLIVMLPDKFSEFEREAQAITDALAAKGYHLAGTPQATVVWESNGVQCKAKLDLWHEAEAHILDLKRCKSAHPNAIDAHIWAYGLDIQHAAYTEAIETIYPELAGRVRFTFLFCESGTSIVVPVQLSGEWQAIGKARWEDGRDRWAACLERGLGREHWPDYAGEGVYRSEPKPWMMEALYGDETVSDNEG